jgi:hypothetical protein
MKGIAIAMETIVYIILAVLVLAVLLYFLTSQANPVQQTAQLERERAQLCSQYVSYDRTCSDITKASGAKTGDNKDLVSELLETCGKIPSASAPIGYTSIQKIQRCCYTCPTSVS